MAVARLRNPAAIRERCREILAQADAGELAHFRLQRERLDATADFVVATIEEHYPDLDIPFHSRWRHFQIGGIDRWASLAATLSDGSRESIARTRIDLAVTSVLLDAGAGDDWRYLESGTDSRSDSQFSRSEGLAVASFHMFAAGAFSSHPDNPLQADAKGLAALGQKSLEQAFQIRADNPLVGAAGRTALLRALGRALTENTELFGEDPPRVGNLYDYLAARAVGKRLPATAIFAAVLTGLSGLCGMTFTW